MDVRSQMRLKLMILAGLPSGAPTDRELDAIISRIEAGSTAAGRQPTNADWIQAAHDVVRPQAKYAYGGEDMSNLNALLLQLRTQQTSGNK